MTESAYDPAAPPPAALLAEVAAAGATADEIAAVRTQDELIELSQRIGLRPAGTRRPLAEIAADAGLTIDAALGICAAIGVPGTAAGEPELYTSDTAWFRTVAVAIELIGADGVASLLRRTATATQHMAHAASGAFRVNVVAPAVDISCEEAVRRNLTVSVLIDGYTDALAQVFRHILPSTIRDGTRAVGSVGELRVMAVGFVDLASSSELGARVDADALARFVEEFNRCVADAARDAGARLVKTIGDEAMFVADDAASVCAATLAVCRYYREHALVSAARAGVAAGELLDLDGDVYGPVVNRAARLVEAAPDGSAVVDDAVASTLGTAWALEDLGTRDFRGIGRHRWWRITPS